MDDLCDVKDLHTVQQLGLVIYSSHSNSANTLPALTCWQIVNKRAQWGKAANVMSPKKCILNRRYDHASLNRIKLWRWKMWKNASEALNLNALRVQEDSNTFPIMSL